MSGPSIFEQGKNILDLVYNYPCAYLFLEKSAFLKHPNEHADNGDNENGDEDDEIDDYGVDTPGGGVPPTCCDRHDLDQG